MTAIASFINKNGVAIAADSAETIMVGEDVQKVYNTSNKIFRLAENLPVGIAVWGEAEYLGIPWEILIKEFGSIIKKPFNGFFDYPEAFLKFINRNRHLFKDTHKRNSMREDLMEIFSKISEDFIEEGKKHRGKKGNLLLEVISQFADNCDKTIPHNDSDLEDALKDRQFKSTMMQCIKKVFQNINLSDEIIDMLCYIAVLQYIQLQKNDSGLLMAGYGNKDIFPAHAIIGDGIFGKHLSIEEGMEVNSKDPGVLRLLGQYNPSNSFIDGIDETIKHFISKQMEDMAAEFHYVISSSEIDSKLRKKIGKFIAKILIDKQQKIEDFIAINHTNPFQESLEFMPIEEMAQLVETMVNLTAYHSRIYDSHETVGGPIDVITINKDKSFTYVKKK